MIKLRMSHGRNEPWARGGLYRVDFQCYMRKRRCVLIEIIPVQVYGRIIQGEICPIDWFLVNGLHFSVVREFRLEHCPRWRSKPRSFEFFLVFPERSRKEGERDKSQKFAIRGSHRKLSTACCRITPTKEIKVHSRKNDEWIDGSIKNCAQVYARARRLSMRIKLGTTHTHTRARIPKRIYLSASVRARILNEPSVWNSYGSARIYDGSSYVYARVVFSPSRKITADRCVTSIFAATRIWKLALGLSLRKHNVPYRRAPGGEGDITRVWDSA